MRINGVSRYNQSFGVRLDDIARRGIRRTVDEVIDKYGKDSDEYNNLKDDINDIVTIRPNCSFCYDTAYSETSAKIWLTQEKWTDKLIEMSIEPKNNMFSAGGIHRIAEKLRLIKK